MGAHELSVGQSDEWYTPPEVFKAIDLMFDLDVAGHWEITPWVPADCFYIENSLNKPWFGRVWMNPPFGARNGYLPWAEKFVQHGNGIALAPDRTSAPWWQWIAHRVASFRRYFFFGTGITIPAPASIALVASANTSGPYFALSSASCSMCAT